MQQTALNADKAREVLEVLDHWVVKVLLKEWLEKEKQRLTDQAVNEWGKGTAPIPIGTASGVHLCLQRIAALRTICQGLIKKEVDNLINGGPTHVN